MDELIRTKSVFGQERDLSRDSSTLANHPGSLPVPVRYSGSVPLAMNYAVSGRLPHTSDMLPCGCYQHLPGSVLTLGRAPFELVQRLIFSNEATGIQSALKCISGQDATASAWEADEFGVRKRTVVGQFPLPSLGLRDNSTIKATFMDTVLLEQPGLRFVVETTVYFDGIPGGCCSMLLRQCLHQGRSDVAEYAVTAEVRPPENSWFKESIKAALLTSVQKLFKEIAISLENQSGGVHAHRRPEATVQQVYFDRAAFKRSLIAILPIIGAALAVGLFITRHRSYGQQPTPPHPISEPAAQRIKEIRQQFNHLVSMPRAGFGSTKDRVASIKDRIAGLLDEPPLSSAA